VLNKQLFILAHQLGDRSFYPTYQQLIKNQWRPYKELKKDQEKQLRQIISFAYEYVPYYRNLFKDLGLVPGNVRIIEDLEKLPVLTKDIIKIHWEELKPVNLSSMKYYTQATGGSTGTPLNYRLSKQDRFLGGALLYRGWGYGGFELGDRMVFLAGSSLDIGTKSRIFIKTHELVRNIRKLSSFDMGETEMLHYAEVLNSFRPKFIRGYPSSLYFYAQWLEKNDIAVFSPDAIVTTADKLFPHMRDTIGRVFNCQIFDEYGVNDGGVSAFECPEHSGLHIDTERSVMEIVDGNGNQIVEGQGQVLATSLYNCAMPFIRYDPGDEVFVTEGECGCGRGHKLLKEIIGRTVDVLVTPEGKHVHGWFFLYFFWEYSKGIKEYQVVQNTVEEIEIKLVIEDDFDAGQLDKIRSIILSKSSKWNIQFKFVDKIERTGAGKYKFIINNVKDDE
jgi:phenylacetate-CoA ligase